MSYMPDNDELTTAERAAFDALPRERRPGDLLEERTLRALRERGLVAARPRPARRWMTHWVGGAIAASLALFATGVAVGQWLGARSTAGVYAEIRAQDALQTAALVQQTGTAYVNALAALAQAADSGSTPAVQQGREVALAVFQAAASQIQRLAPSDTAAQRLPLAGAVPADSAESTTRYIWF